MGERRKMNTKKQYETYKEVLRRTVHREGVETMLEWLDRTDIATAPASTKYHGAYEGGLVEHLLDVYAALLQTSDGYGLNLDEESMALVALTHDLCKVNSYKQDWRNVKDEKGVWHKVPCYKFEEDFHFGGHGSKSVYLVQSFIELDPEEAAAINCHMGAYDSTTYSNPSPVFEDSPLAWALHVADENATFRFGWEV
jgi:hypothetical protein